MRTRTLSNEDGSTPDAPDRTVTMQLGSEPDAPKGETAGNASAQRAPPLQRRAGAKRKTQNAGAKGGKGAKPKKRATSKKKASAKGRVSSSSKKASRTQGAKTGGGRKRASSGPRAGDKRMKTAKAVKHKVKRGAGKTTKRGQKSAKVR